MPAQSITTAPPAPTASLPRLAAVRIPDATTVALVIAATVTMIGVLVAPAMTFFIALAVIVLVGLDRAARSADEVFESLAAR